MSQPPSPANATLSPGDYGILDRLDRTSRDTALEPDTLHVLARSGHATRATYARQV